MTTDSTPHFQPYKILFLCTGNSARSIMAEYAMKNPRFGKGRFESYSAGASPKGEVHPMTLRVLKESEIEVNDARSKSWDEYREVKFDFVITVCDHARESCPLWPGQPIIAHWGAEDPAAVEGEEWEIHRAFYEAFRIMSRRCQLLASLPIQSLETLRLEEKTRAIGNQ